MATMRMVIENNNTTEAKRSKWPVDQRCFLSLLRRSVPLAVRRHLDYALSVALVAVVRSDS